MSLTEIPIPRAANPVETVEQVAASHGWSFARAGENELTLVVSGVWADYQVFFTWMNEIELLHLACAIDLKFSERRRADMTDRPLPLSSGAAIALSAASITARPALVMRTQSPSNPSPAPNSLLTGKLTGNFAESGRARRFSRPLEQQIQCLTEQFPAQRNREFSDP